MGFVVFCLFFVCFCLFFVVLFIFGGGWFGLVMSSCFLFLQSNIGSVFNNVVKVTGNILDHAYGRWQTLNKNLGTAHWACYILRIIPNVIHVSFLLHVGLKKRVPTNATKPMVAPSQMGMNYFPPKA